MITINSFNKEDFNSITTIHLNSFKSNSNSNSFHESLYSKVSDNEFKSHLINNDLINYVQDKTNTKIGLKATIEEELVGYVLMEERGIEGSNNSLSSRTYPKGFNQSFATALMKQEPLILEHHYRLRIIAVKPSVQGSGVGTALMNYCTNLADEKKLSVYLAATEEAAPFYLRHFFVNYGKPCVHESVTTQIMVRLPQPPEPLLISLAIPSDSFRFAQIHRAAFSPFTFHRTIYGQCPPSALDETFSTRFKNIISNPLNTMLKATRGETILAFAYWELPLPLNTPLPPAIPRIHPPGINPLAIPWFQKVDTHARSVLIPHYHLHIIGTEPSFQRMGIAKRLIQWGFDRADEIGVNCHLDATIEGLPVYERLGFVKTGDDPIAAGDGSFDVTPMVRFPKKREGVYIELI